MPRVPLEPTPAPLAASPRPTPPPSQCQCAPLISVGKSQKPPLIPPTFTFKMPTPGYGHCVSALARGGDSSAKDPNPSVTIETQTAACVFITLLLNGPFNDLLCSVINPTATLA